MKRERERERVSERSEKSLISNLLCGNIEIHILSLPLAEKLKNVQVQHAFTFTRSAHAANQSQTKPNQTKPSNATLNQVKSTAIILQ